VYAQLRRLVDNYDDRGLGRYIEGVLVHDNSHLRLHLAYDCGNAISAVRTITFRPLAPHPLPRPSSFPFIFISSLSAPQPVLTSYTQ
jgi:hypothetical protein